MLRAKGFATPPTNTAPFITGAGLANCCYVSKGGSDTTGTRGSIAKPFLTIAAALTASQAGDVIVIGAGTWTENVALLENRSIVGAGARATTIDGTLTLTAGATSVNNSITLAALRVTGAATINLAAKLAGDNLLNFNDALFEQTLTLTRATNGKKEAYLSNVLLGSTLTSNFGKITATGCELAALALTSGGGGEHWRFKGCSIVNATIASAQGNTRFVGCTITGSLTHSDTYLGDSLLWTVGCELTAATITISGGVWYEYGCTLDYSQIGGAGAHKRISFQRFAATISPGDNTVALPHAIGSTDYHVTVELQTQNGGGDYCVIISGKGVSSFTAKNTSGDSETVEFGIHYRKA